MVKGDLPVSANIIKAILENNPGSDTVILAEQIHKLTTTKGPDGKEEVNVQANLIAHAVVGAVTSYASGNPALAGASGAAMGEYIAQQMYPGVKREDLSEEQRQTISALGTLAAGLAGGVAGDSASGAVAGAQAGKNAVENNELFNLPSGLNSYGNSASTLGMSMKGAGATAQQINEAMSKNVKGDLPEGANITKVIVNGYKDGVLIAGAAYLGPAATVGKVVGGAVIGAIANGTYQWFDMSQPGKEDKSYDFLGTGAAAITGGLAPGRSIWQNVGIATSCTAFTDGPDIGAMGASAAGAWAGGIFGVYAPGIVSSATGKELPGSVYDFVGGGTSEFVNGFTKDINKPDPVKKEN